MTGAKFARAPARNAPQQPAPRAPQTSARYTPPPIATTFVSAPRTMPSATKAMLVQKPAPLQPNATIAYRPPAPVFTPDTAKPAPHLMVREVAAVRAPQAATSPELSALSAPEQAYQEAPQAGGGAGSGGGGGGGGQAPPEPPYDASQEQDAPQGAPPPEQNDAPYDSFNDDNAPPPRADANGMPPRTQDWETDIPWQEMQGFAGEASEPDESLKIFAHVHGPDLCLTGVCRSSVGIFPLTLTVPAPVDAPQGPLDVGAEIPESMHQPLSKAVGVLQMGATDKAQKLAAESVVIRARAGDQNAMALIAMVRDEAARGSPRAQASKAMMQSYIDKHPVESESAGRFGSEPKPLGSSEMHSAAVALANGAPLSPARIYGMASTFGAENDSQLFLHAVDNHQKEGLVEAMRGRFGAWAAKVAEFGRNVGKARSIQQVRLPGSSLSAYDARVGWEHGE